MDDPLSIDFGPNDQRGRRLVTATYENNLLHRDHFDVDNASLRNRFVEALAFKIAREDDPDWLADVDARLLREAEAAGCGQDESTAVSADAVRLSDVPPTNVAWLWPGRIALGKLTLLAGDPGMGKSYLTLDMAARVSHGGPWPGEARQGDTERGRPGVEERPPGSVILLSAEDDLADTIRPRLEALGADCARIVAIRAITAKNSRGCGRRPFDLARDLEHLAMELDRLPDCRLIVVDPISAYLGRNAENINAEVRHLLAPLAALAAERHLAVVVVTHLRKSEGTAVQRSLGSVAFVAAARSAWIVCRHPHAAERRLILPVKNNLAADGEGLCFTIEPREPDGAAVVCWSAERVTWRADDVLCDRSRPAERRDHERREVIGWLQAFLADGPHGASEVRTAAEAHGFSYATLRRAFREVGGVAVREGAGVPARWTWGLGEGGGGGVANSEAEFTTEYTEGTEEVDWGSCRRLKADG